MKHFRKKSIKGFIVVALFLMGGLFSCEPTPDELKLFDEFVVSTNYEPDASFGSFTTFTLRTDTIGLVSNTYGDDTIIVGSNYARPVIGQVRTNMVDRGYQQVDVDQNPDLAVNIYIVKNLNLFQQVNYYPGYYFPGYYNYYGGYYGGYYGYPYVDTYAYNTGVLVVEIIDLVNVTQQNQVRVVWNAYMGDVFSSINRNQQSLNAIDQAFTQSPYLITE